MDDVFKTNHSLADAKSHDEYIPGIDSKTYFFFS